MTDITKFHEILNSIDPIHAKTNWFNNPMTVDVWKDKYAYRGEKSLKDTIHRAVNGVYANDSLERKAVSPKNDVINTFKSATILACELGLFMPAGRILAGAGTTKRVTLMNCYVNSVVEDSMEGIMSSVSHAAFTMQQGGGVGTCFSTIRPRGAILKRLGDGAVASGVLPFMDMWNAMCSTIMSAGSRRGAMMATLCDTHPDLLEYIEAKKTKGRLTNFNMSILISDAFMEAVHEDEDWLLYFSIAPVKRDQSLEEYDFEDDDGTTQYVYAVYKARDLWEKITRTTYEYSEPGVIFVDRINNMNNLQYCEDIQCTNPCGEQPLPPHGTCNLGAVILSRMVKNPFTEDAYFDFDMLKVVTRLGVRFLDNVIDVTNYPLPEQRAEEIAKRRLGEGIAGLADALAQLCVRYGSIKGARIASDIMKTIAIEAYTYSIELSQEKGRFPKYSDLYVDCGFVAKRLPTSLRDEIKKHGIRNGLLLTIAPTGTTSIVFGNISSGVEPVFSLVQMRKVLQPDGTWKPYKAYSYIAMLYETHQKMNKATDPYEYPSYMVTAEDLTIAEHVRMQSACQEWVDASVSKTVNVPTEMSYDEFVTVYELAYNGGCKGCTTYRPSEVRGSILEDASKVKPSEVTLVPEGFKRPQALTGATYKVRWPSMSAAMYITINSAPNPKTGKIEPYEMFFASKDARHSDWMTALTLMISGIFRSGIDPMFVPHELKQVTSMHDTAWINTKHYASPVAYIGYIIEQHLTPNSEESNSVQVSGQTQSIQLSQPIEVKPQGVTHEVCPQCYAPAIIKTEGCKKCTNCTYSSCN